jgi:hypothetical protein
VTLPWPLRLMQYYGWRLAAPLLRVLRKMRAAVLESLEDVPGYLLLGEILRRLDRERWGRRFREDAGLVLLAAILSGSSHELRAFGVPMSHRVRSGAGGLAQSIMAGWFRIIDSFRRAVVRLFRRAERVGSNVVEAVRRFFRPTTLKVRANRIAEIETHGAIEGGREIARKELEYNGFRLAKVWTTRDDNRVRPTHERADGQTVPMFGQFIVGGSPCEYPGDPRLPIEERAGCRCVITVKVLARPVMIPLVGVV